MTYTHLDFQSLSVCDWRDDLVHWYKTVLLHFLDIATNAFLLHREMSSAKHVQPMAHKEFMVELVCQLCGMDKAGVPLSRRANHVPVPIDTATDPDQKNTKGRLKCQLCHQVDNRRRDTPWECQACDLFCSGLCCLLSFYKS